jgi:hypothetical protein
VYELHPEKDMKLIELTQGQAALVDDENFEEQKSGFLCRAFIVPSLKY